MEKCVARPQNGSGTTGHSQAKLKKKDSILIYTHHRNSLKTDHRTKCKTQNYETPRG